MIVNFPIECNKESSRWSFTTKLNEVLRFYHNESCLGMTAQQAEDWRKVNFYPQSKAVMHSKNEQIAISRLGTHWNPRIPDHVSNGIIHYPAGLDQENEGSRGSFLIGLEYKLNLIGQDIQDLDMRTVQLALSQASIDAINGTYHNPTLEDIIDGT